MQVVSMHGGMDDGQHDKLYFMSFGHVLWYGIGIHGEIKQKNYKK